MDTTSIERIIEEVRTEFQIPPYFEDDALKNYIKEGEATLLGLNPGRDVETDELYRMLLKNYAYYAFHHKVNEWKVNYAELVLQWQLSTEVEE